MYMAKGSSVIAVSGHLKEVIGEYRCTGID